MTSLVHPTETISLDPATIRQAAALLSDPPPGTSARFTVGVQRLRRLLEAHQGERLTGAEWAGRASTTSGLERTAGGDDGSVDRQLKAGFELAQYWLKALPGAGVEPLRLLVLAGMAWLASGRALPAPDVSGFLLGVMLAYEWWTSSQPGDGKAPPMAPARKGQRASSAKRLSPEAYGALHLLLRSAFSSSELDQLLAFHPPYRPVLPALPGENVSVSERAFAAIAALDRHGLLDEQFLDCLEQARPGRKGEIHDIRTHLSST